MFPAHTVMLVHVMVNHLVVLAHVGSDMHGTRQLGLVEQAVAEQLVVALLQHGIDSQVVTIMIDIVQLTAGMLMCKIITGSTRMTVGALARSSRACFCTRSPR